MGAIAEVSKRDILRVIYELKNVHDFDFSNFAEQSFKRRIEYVLTTYNLATVDDLLRQIRDDKNYCQKFVNDITVNTTELFRDSDIWLQLRRNILTRFRDKPNINIWHAGCSSGEEVYSMLILLNEHNLLDKTKVFATDINTDILNKAREGLFNNRLHHAYFHNFDKVVNVNPLNFDEALNISYEKYFDIDSVSKTFRVKRFLQDKVTFKYHNLVGGSIFYKFDLIFCRNVIIYFNTELQNKVISLFHESLFDDGMLLLGTHENIVYLPIGTKYEQKTMKGLYYKKS